MNTYHKYVPNVFLAKCTEAHNRGDEITITTRRGQEHQIIVHNLVGKNAEHFFYSFVRADGFDAQARALKKAAKYTDWAGAAHNKSDALCAASREGSEFLALGEPIKVGHHSERRHRALIERNHDRMSKAVEMEKKAEAHERKAEYWASKAGVINLSMPESLEFFNYQLEQATREHQKLKDNPELRAHGYSLAYANKSVKDLAKKAALAQKLWGDN